MKSPDTQSSVSCLFEEKMSEQLKLFNSSAEQYKLERANTVRVSSVLKLDDALARIKALEDKQDEMLRLHAGMVSLVNDLVAVISTSVSGQTPHLSPSPPQPRLLVKPQVNAADSLELRSSPPPKAIIKEEAGGEDTNERKEEQKTYIQRMSSFIDERAAHYCRGRHTLSREPYPRVDWSKINRHTIKNLPQPKLFPIIGCPQHPEVYPDAPNPKGRIRVCSTNKDCSLPGCKHETPIGGHPFGSHFGFETNLGIVSMPTCPIGGYIFTEEGWKIYAAPA